MCVWEGAGRTSEGEEESEIPSAFSFLLVSQNDCFVKFLHRDVERRRGRRKRKRSKTRNR